MRSISGVPCMRASAHRPLRLSTSSPLTKTGAVTGLIGATKNGDGASSNYNPSNVSITVGGKPLHIHRGNVDLVAIGSPQAVFWGFRSPMRVRNVSAARAQSERSSPSRFAAALHALRSPAERRSVSRASRSPVKESSRGGSFFVRRRYW